jgi:ribosomal protein L22
MGANKSISEAFTEITKAINGMTVKEAKATLNAVSQDIDRLSDSMVLSLHQE